MGKVTIGTCASDDCLVSDGLIMAGEPFDLHPVMVKGKVETELYHRECNPHADHSKDAA